MNLGANIEVATCIHPCSIRWSRRLRLYWDRNLVVVVVVVHQTKSDSRQGLGRTSWFPSRVRKRLIVPWPNRNRAIYTCNWWIVTAPSVCGLWSACVALRQGSVANVSCLFRHMNLVFLVHQTKCDCLQGLWLFDGSLTERESCYYSLRKWEL